VAVEPYGEFPYYIPQSGGKVSFDYKITFEGQTEPAEEADVAEARVYKQGEQTDSNLLTTEQLDKSGEGTLELDISGFDAAADSPLLIEFFFQKEWTQGARSGATDEEAIIAMMALAIPAVAAVSSDPVPTEVKADKLKAEDAVKLEVADWGALVYDEPDVPTLVGEADPARYPSGTEDQTKWRRKLGGEDWEELSATGKTADDTAPEGVASKWLRYEAYLEGQVEAKRPEVAYEPPTRGSGGPEAGWKNEDYVQASNDYRQAEADAAAADQDDSAAAA
jgi:hypothetical protein